MQTCSFGVQEQCKFIDFEDIDGNGFPEALTTSEYDVYLHYNPFMPVGVPAAGVEGSVLIYPNPVLAGEVIRFSKPHEVLKVNLTNMIGQTIATWNSAGNIQIPQIASGIYLMQVEMTNNRSSVVKLIVER
jgi:hypothetical protein